MSDFATALDLEIVKNPYRFLGLPQGAPIEDVRRSYIRLAKLYHPDLVNPSLSGKNLPQLYSQSDLEAAGIECSIEELIEHLTRAFEDEEKAEALERIRLLAHKKMVEINRAYYEIKSRYDPERWNQLFGYDFEPVFNEEEEEWDRVVHLEGRGKIVVYPNHYEFWVAGPYLSFDYGPDDDHPWEDWYFRHELNLKHMFAHIELREGKPLSGILLEPLFDCFGLDESQSQRLIELLCEGKSTEEVMDELGIPHENKINFREDWDGWLYSLKFRRQINEITTLMREPTRHENGIELIVEEDGLTLKDFDESRFSEADYMLFLTLAYGPLMPRPKTDTRDSGEALRGE